MATLRAIVDSVIRITSGRPAEIGIHACASWTHFQTVAAAAPRNSMASPGCLRTRYASITPATASVLLSILMPKMRVGTESGSIPINRKGEGKC